MLTTTLASLALLAPPIADADGLRAHLCAGAPSPFEALDPAMQRRVLESLQVDERGVFFSALGFLKNLPEKDARAILDLFDLGAYTDVVTGWEGAAPQPAKVHALVPMTDAYCAGEADLAASLAALPVGPAERRLPGWDAIHAGAEGAADRAGVAKASRTLFEERFGAGVPPADLAAADDFTLRALFQQVSWLSAEASHPPAEALMLAAFDELARRGHAPTRALHDHYVATRRWGAAAALRARHPDLTAPPPVPEAGPRTVWAPGADGALVARSVPADYTGLLVLASPSCPFAMAADEEIAADPALDAAVAEGVWVVPPDTALRSHALDTYNGRRPHRPLSHLADRAEWPAFTLWSTPRFYFLQAGQVVDMIDGWPPSDGEAKRARLREGLAMIGQPVD